MSRKVLFIALLVWLVWSPAASASPAVGPGDAELRFAATQHEIIAILIEEEEFDRVVPEFQKILDLGFSGEQERLVVKEAWVVANGLLAAQRYDLAHQVVDSALNRLQSEESEFQLLMLKGKLYKQQGMVQEAVRTYRQAQRIRQ